MKHTLYLPDIFSSTYIHNKQDADKYEKISKKRNSYIYNKKSSNKNTSTRLSYSKVLTSYTYKNNSYNKSKYESVISNSTTHKNTSNITKEVSANSSARLPTEYIYTTSFKVEQNENKEDIYKNTSLESDSNSENSIFSTEEKEKEMEYFKKKKYIYKIPVKQFVRMFNFERRMLLENSYKKDKLFKDTCNKENEVDIVTNEILHLKKIKGLFEGYVSTLQSYVSYLNFRLKRFKNEKEKKEIKIENLKHINYIIQIKIQKVIYQIKVLIGKKHFLIWVKNGTKDYTKFSEDDKKEVDKDKEKIDELNEIYLTLTIPENSNICIPSAQSKIIETVDDYFKYYTGYVLTTLNSLQKYNFLSEELTEDLNQMAVVKKQSEIMYDKIKLFEKEESNKLKKIEELKLKQQQLKKDFNNMPVIVNINSKVCNKINSVLSQLQNVCDRSIINYDIEEGHYKSSNAKPLETVNLIKLEKLFDTYSTKINTYKQKDYILYQQIENKINKKKIKKLFLENQELQKKIRFKMLSETLKKHNKIVYKTKLKSSSTETEKKRFKMTKKSIKINKKNKKHNEIIKELVNE